MEGTGKQFTVYNNDAGMSIWNICFVLEELGLTYQDVQLDFAKKEQKAPAYLELNPNGKIPTLVDHANGDLVVWESNSILKYLVSQYDKEHKISVDDPKDQIALDTWLFFQASGQGPYFGQAQWFQKFHPEHVPSAIERYQSEIKRVLGVLDSVLAKQDWLVGGKPTIADLSFVKYTDYAVKELLEPGFEFAKEYPHAAAWHAKLIARPAVDKVMKLKEAAKIARGNPIPVF